MNSKTISLFRLLILLTFVVVISCREESDENIFTEEEVVVADSDIADLILRTTQKNGSGDDILDGSSCYSVQLPVTITIEDIKIVVETKEDFEKIEDLFEDLEEEIDDLEFTFPITLIAEDFTEIIVANDDVLERLLDDCDADEDDTDNDDQIECINFKYPFTVSLFDKNSELIESVTFNNDKELHRFIKNLSVDQIVNVGFPIVLINADQTEITINNLRELRKEIRKALDEDCDKNRNNNRLLKTLTSKPVKVQKYKIDESNETKDFRGYVFDFAMDGTVTIFQEGNSEEVQGLWVVKGPKKRKISLDFGQQQPLSKLNGTWNIKKVVKTRVMLRKRDRSDKSKAELFFKQQK